jgi:hypothetical protein
VRERTGEEPGRATLGGMAPGPDACADGCCRARGSE